MEFEDYEKETESSKQITSDARPTGYISEEEEDQNQQEEEKRIEQADKVDFVKDIFAKFGLSTELY